MSAKELVDRIIAELDPSILLQEVIERLASQQQQDNKPTVSFSKSTWEGAACHFGLRSGAEHRPLSAFPTVQPPDVLLPKRVHQSLQEQGWAGMDVYGELHEQRNEATRVRTLESWLVGICALFYGRINNYPERPMKGGAGSRGGAIEYEITGSNGIWLTVVEVKHTLSSGIALANQIAQLLYELEAAHAFNSKCEYAHTTVYGILTDCTSYYFYSYNGSCFSLCSSPVHIAQTRGGFLQAMLHVSNLIFGFLLEAYISSLEVLQSSSETKIKGDGLSNPSFGSTLPPLNTHPLDQAKKRSKKSSRPSLDRWDEALASALCARDLLTRTVDSLSADERDQRALQGLVHLSHSVGVIPTRLPSEIDFTSHDKIHGFLTSSINNFFTQGCTQLAACGTNLELVSKFELMKLQISDQASKISDQDSQLQLLRAENAELRQKAHINVPSGSEK